MSYQLIGERNDNARGGGIARKTSHHALLQGEIGTRSSRRHHRRKPTTTSNAPAFTRSTALSWAFHFPDSWSPATVHSLISFAAGTVMCLFGYEQGVFGGILVGNFDDYFNHPSPSMTGFVTGLYDLGCFAGAILTLFVGEWLGRKRMLIVFTIIMATGIVLQTVAQNMTQLLWGRLIAGIGNGGNTSTAPIWHVETSHFGAKGKAVVKEMIVNVFGFVMSNIITLACSGISTEAQWRFPLGIQLIYIIIILGMVPLLPESPRWLLSRGRDAEAQAVLAMLNDEDPEEEFNTIRDSVRLEQAAEVSWWSLFKRATPLRRVALGMLIQILQQLTGINLICYYLPFVLKKSVGLSELASRLLATGNAISFMMAVTGALFFIERLGRRQLLMMTAVVQSIAFLGISLSTEIGHDGGDHVAGIVAAVFISLYFLAFGFGWCATPWLYPAEVNSLSMRTKGAALATGCDWLFNWLVVQSTPVGIHYLRWGIYLIYAVLNACFVPIVYFFIVETAGKTLEEIDRWFDANPGWFVHRLGSELGDLKSVGGIASGIYQEVFQHADNEHETSDRSVSGSDSGRGTASGAKPVNAALLGNGDLDEDAREYDPGALYDIHDSDDEDEHE